MIGAALGFCVAYFPLRPAIVDEKSRFGDFEIDLINGAHHKGNLLTANDRMSMFCILEPLPTKDATALADALIAAFSPYKMLLHTVTSDNGKEFADHARIAQRLNVVVSRVFRKNSLFQHQI